MARFLSAEWFAELGRAAPVHIGALDGRWVLEQVVTATPDGEVRYQLVVADGTAQLRGTPTEPPAVTFTSDYATATAIAQGRLSTQAALLDGRVRVSGNLSGVAEALRLLAGLDLVPAGVRAATTY